MNENYALQAQSAPGNKLGSSVMDLTLRQNVDRQIEEAEKRLQELKDTKARLETTGIIDSRIDDLQRAMRW